MGPSKEENGDDTQSSTPEYRDRLRTWLIKMIDRGTIPGLHWENDEKTIFRMPWKHAGRQDYSLEDDSRIFMAWAIHSGRYREGIDKPEPIIWKTRLRCALNKMPDIREIPERSRLDISEPYRVYHFLPPVHKDTQIRRRLQRRHSHAQNSEHKTNSERQNSPSYGVGATQKEPIPTNQTRKMNFQDNLSQGRVNEKTSPGNYSEFKEPPRFDFRNTPPWLGGPTMVPRAENSLFNRLNFSGLTSPLAVRNLINPYNFFAVPPRDLRPRPEFDFSLLTYPRQPVIDNTSIHSLFVPPTSIGRVPVDPKVTRESLFNNNLTNAAEEYHKYKSNHRERSTEDIHLEQNRWQKDKDNLLSNKRPQNHHRSRENIRYESRDDRTSSNAEKINGVSTTSSEKTKNTESDKGEICSEDDDTSKSKIEFLEKEILKWKKAHDQEKSLRESLERQHEHLKKNLENMGGDILAMIMRSYQTKETLDNHDEQVPEKDGVSFNKFTPNLPLFRRRSDSDLRDSYSSTTSATENCSQNNTNTEETVLSNSKRSRKRLTATKTGPLDLSSPPLKRRKNEVPHQISTQITSSESFEESVINTENTVEPFIKREITHWQYGLSETTNRISSDYDEADTNFPAVSSSNRKAIIVESPSTVSSCSSSEDSVLGIPGNSPVTPLFKADTENSYAVGFKSRADGAIQVT